MRELAAFGLTPVARRLVDVDVPSVVDTALATFAALDGVLLPARLLSDAGVFLVVVLRVLSVFLASDFLMLLLPAAAFLLPVGFFLLAVAVDDVAARPFLPVFTVFDAAPERAFDLLVADVFGVAGFVAVFFDAAFVPLAFFAAALPAVLCPAVFFAAGFFFATPAPVLGAVCLAVFAALPLLVLAAFVRLAPAFVFDAAARVLPVVSFAAERFALVPFAFAVLRVDFAISFTMRLVPLWLGGRLL